MAALERTHLMGNNSELKRNERIDKNLKNTLPSEAHKPGSNAS